MLRPDDPDRRQTPPRRAHLSLLANDIPTGHSLLSVSVMQSIASFVHVIFEVTAGGGGRGTHEHHLARDVSAVQFLQRLTETDFFSSHTPPVNNNTQRCESNASNDQHRSTPGFGEALGTRGRTGEVNLRG